MAQGFACLTPGRNPTFLPFLSERLSWPKKAFPLIKTKINTSPAFLKRLNRIILKTQSGGHHHSFSVCITCSLVIIELEIPVLSLFCAGDTVMKKCFKHLKKSGFSQIQKKIIIINSCVSHSQGKRVQIKAGYC